MPRLGPIGLIRDPAPLACRHCGASVVTAPGAVATEKENAFGLLGSLNMLLATPGGFDFTGADCQAWMREAGFSRTRVEPLTDTVSMIVATK
jgi:hypothetical protein